ncbi:thermonuclease family protein [Pseudomonas sp. F1_0610]|uniref:thermonuclease family protein n=1 Tax=Pseudomonas sp. F1_0610 TaxID=3114284 RepID=UPI0039C3CBB7
MRWLQDVDRYGTTVGRIYIKKMNINCYFLKSGDDWMYPRYVKDSQLFKLQVEAKAAQRGLSRLPEGERAPQ